jgi:hypothetical protein
VAVRQPQKHDIVSGEHLGVGGLKNAPAERQQVRVVFGQRGARARGRCQRADRQPAVDIGGVAEQQPKDLTAGITAGTGHGHRSHAVDSACLCRTVQTHSRRCLPDS